MKHYHCDGGCKTQKHAPGECTQKNCPKFGRDLCECFCLDGKHCHDLPEIKMKRKMRRGKIHIISLSCSLGIAGGIYYLITILIYYSLGYATPVIQVLIRHNRGISFYNFFIGLLLFFGLGVLLGGIVSIVYNVFRNIKKL